jgi:hypothetical protein
MPQFNVTVPVPLCIHITKHAQVRWFTIPSVGQLMAHSQQAPMALASAFPKWRKVKPRNKKIFKALSFLAAITIQVYYSAASRAMFLFCVVFLSVMS